MGKSPKESAIGQEGEAVLRRLEFVVPDSVSNRFSNFTVVHHESEVFTLSFYEIQTPQLLGSSQEERRKEAEELTSVPALCVARIVVTPTHFKKLLDAMQENYKKYQKTQGIADTL